MDSPKTSSPKTVVSSLDGIRGFACFLVVVYHLNRLVPNVFTTPFRSINRIISSFLLAGNNGVTLFFVLSGFLLFLPYAKAILFDAPWPSLRNFYLRRAFRIWPGYYVSLALLILFAHQEYLQLDHWKQLLLFLVFWMDSSHRTYQSIDGPFWTLAVEWQYYVLLPFMALAIAWVAKRGSLRRRMIQLFVCLFGLIAWGLLTRYWGHGWDPVSNPTYPEYLHLIGFLVYGQTGKFFEDFAIGMMICVLYVYAQQCPERSLARALPRYSWIIWGVGVIGCCFAAYWPATVLLYRLAPTIGAHAWLSELSWSLPFGLCVLGVLFGSPALRWIWEQRPLRWIGSLSYGIYMWHLPLLFWFSDTVIRPHHGWSVFAKGSLFWLFAATAIVGFCWLFYRYIEQPWISIGARLTKAKPKVVPAQS